MKSQRNSKAFLLILSLVFFQASAYAKAKLVSVYLTFEEESTSQSVTVNAFFAGKSAPLEIHFDESSRDGQPESYNYKVESRRTNIKKTGYSVHSAKLDGVQPGTKYFFVGSNDAIGLTQEYWFQTLPEDDRPIRLIQGGDMGPSASIPLIAESALSLNPDLILIGGDIAYANGKTKDFENWVEWFGQMNKVIVKASGRIIPLILAIGNHETSGIFNMQTEVQSAPDSAPFFFKLFPQNGSSSHFVRTLGNHSVIYILDTGHTKTHWSQSKWLKKVMPDHKVRKNQIALYHIPLYPSHRSYNGFQSILGRQTWLPVFDKHGLKLAFENHDHTFKRTKMLKDGDEVDKDGTIYVGDGAWGKGTRSVEPRKYLQKSLSVQHVWFAELSPGIIKLMASGTEGEVFDRFELDTSSGNKLREAKE